MAICNVVKQDVYVGDWAFKKLRLVSIIDTVIEKPSEVLFEE